MTEEKKLSPWTLICRESNDDLGNFWPDNTWTTTERLTVPGGWIVRTMIEVGPPATWVEVSSVFVPCSICGKDSHFDSNRFHKFHWQALTLEAE